MKKAVITMLAVVAMVSSPAAFASNWIEIGQGPVGERMEIDADSINRSGPVVKVWVRRVEVAGVKIRIGTTTGNATTAAGAKFDTYMDRESIDCSQGTVILSSGAYFYQGYVVETDYDVMSFDIGPDSYQEVVEHAVCK